MPTDDDFEDDDRPRRPRRDDEDADEDRPARRPRRRDEDDDYDRPRRRSDRGAGLAIASLVLGIIALPVACCLNWISLPFSVTSIILGFVSRSQGGSRGTSTAGIICSFVSIFIVVLVIVLVATKVIDIEQMKQMQMQNKR